jgi:hypothetical protein
MAFQEFSKNCRRMEDRSIKASRLAASVMPFYGTETSCGPDISPQMSEVVRMRKASVSLAYLVDRGLGG